MIKPASSGDLRITTGFFLGTLSLSLSQHKEGIITGGTNHHVQQLNLSHLEDGRYKHKKKEEKNICKHIYLNVNGLPIMRVEIKCKMRGNLVKPPMISG